MVIDSPLFPIVADIVLDKIFVSVREKFHGIRTKCVDDSLPIVNYDYLSKIFFIYCNNNFDKLSQFTYEEESSNSKNFLDVTVIKEDRHLIFKHFCKPTYTGRTINFHSNQPLHYKTNTAKCLFQNWKATSDIRFHEEIYDDFKKL